MRVLINALRLDSVLQGWCWEDDDWHIDMTGQETHAVDSEGWSYAVDFGWLTLPPTAGSGRYRKVQLAGPGSWTAVR